MSRHRLIRDIDVDDYFDYTDEDYEPNDLEYTEKKQEAVKSLSKKLGESFGITEISDTLSYYQLNEEKAIKWLVDGIDPDARKDDIVRTARKKDYPKPQATEKPKKQKAEKNDPSPKIINQPIKKAHKIDIVKALETRPKQFSFVVAGHVDAGKSTLVGQLLAKTEKRSGFSNLAWIMDSNQQERDRGVTITESFASLYHPTMNVLFTVLDSPGHSDFVPSMISGAAKADLAVLVVDSRPGEFEKGHLGGGQTREHLIILKSLEVNFIVVAINKMDANTVLWSQSRFNEISENLVKFLSFLKFARNQIFFIPCSAVSGANLITIDSESCPWYSGPSLLDLIASLEIPAKQIDTPFRLAVNDYSIGGQSGNSVTFFGQITSGSVQNSDSIIAMPMGQQCTVRTVCNTSHDTSINSSESLNFSKYGVSGDHVAIGVKNFDTTYLQCNGMVLCSIDNPITCATLFEAKILVFDPKVPITFGFPIIFYQGSCSEDGFITKLIASIDKSTGKYLPKRPRCLIPGSAALVEISLRRSVCIEPKSRFFGRFLLRSSGQTVAMGSIEKVVNFT